MSKAQKSESCPRIHALLFKQVFSHNQDAQQDGHGVLTSSVHHLLSVLPRGDLLQGGHGGQVQGAHGDGARDLLGLRVPTLHPFCQGGGEVQFGTYDGCKA